VQDSRDVPNNTDSMKYPKNGVNPMPRVPEGSSYRQPGFNPPVRPAAQPNQTRPAAVRLDRIVSLSGHNLEGTITSAAGQTQAGARLVFVSAERTGCHQAVTADNAGQFQVSLDAGSWLVYTHDAEGRAVFSQKVEVNDREARPVNLVSR
jgi:hypothetical protein